MRIELTSLEGHKEIVELEDVGNVVPNDDVIYFDGIPYHLSSAKPFVESFLGEKKKTIIELMALAYLVQTETKYCVFIRFSGHVDQLEIDIRESRENWQREVLKTELFTEFKKFHDQKDPLAILKAKKNILTHILEEHSIPFEECDAEYFTEVLYTF